MDDGLRHGFLNSCGQAPLKRGDGGVPVGRLDLGLDLPEPVLGLGAPCPPHVDDEWHQGGARVATMLIAFLASEADRRSDARVRVSRYDGQIHIPLTARRIQVGDVEDGPLVGRISTGDRLLEVGV